MSEHQGKGAMKDLVRFCDKQQHGQAIAPQVYAIASYVSDLERRLEKTDAELGEDKRDLLLEIGGLQAALWKARNLALKEAESVIEARIPIYTEIGQLNALRECLSSIRALKSSPPTPDQGDGA